MDHINMRVRNLAESVEFYRSLFGFEIKENHADDREEPWMILGRPGVAYLCLYEHPDKVRQQEALRINHFGWVLEDFEAAAEELRARGVRILYDGPVEWQHSRSLYIQDPNGYEIELSEKFGGGHS